MAHNRRAPLERRRRQRPRRRRRYSTPLPPPPSRRHLEPCSKNSASMTQSEERQGSGRRLSMDFFEFRPWEAEEGGRVVWSARRKASLHHLRRCSKEVMRITSRCDRMYPRSDLDWGNSMFTHVLLMRLVGFLQVTKKCVEDLRKHAPVTSLEMFQGP